MVPVNGKQSYETRNPALYSNRFCSATAGQTEQRINYWIQVYSFFSLTLGGGGIWVTGACFTMGDGVAVAATGAWEVRLYFSHCASRVLNQHRCSSADFVITTIRSIKLPEIKASLTSNHLSLLSSQVTRHHMSRYFFSTWI